MDSHRVYTYSFQSVFQSIIQTLTYIAFMKLDETGMRFKLTIIYDAFYDYGSQWLISETQNEVLKLQNHIALHMSML